MIRNEFLKIVEYIYAKLYRSTRENQIRLQKANKDAILKQGSEITPDITLSEIEEAVLKMKANGSRRGQNSDED